MKREKATRFKIYFFMSLLLIGMGCFLSACGKQNLSEDKKDKVESLSASAIDSQKDTYMKISMIDVGQGLSILIEVDGEYLIYDGGGRSHSDNLVAFLKNRNIEHLKYLVCSHYDEDHIAGLVGVFYNYGVETAITPDYQGDTKIYESFRKALAASSAKEVHPLAGDEYALGQARIQILGPKEYNQAKENESSIVVRISLGDFSAIITGDAEYGAEQEMVEDGLLLKSDLYVVGHHGSNSSTSDIFLKAVSPDYAFISVGADNDYGHPTSLVLDRLKEKGIKMFRTDLQGDVTLTWTDKEITFDQEPCSDWTSGTDKEIVSDQTKENTETSDEYVLNNNTKKFHFPFCKSVNDIKEKNREDVNESREELVSQGYSPCGNCHP